MSFDLYMLGAEQQSWVTVLIEAGIEHVGLSFWSLAKRIEPDKVDLSRRLEGLTVLLESGGYQANKSPQALTVGEWEEYAAGYERFVECNLSALSMVTELDCPALGPAWMMARRHAFYNDLPDYVQFLPVWHPDQGEKVLAELVERYERVSVVASVFDDRGSTAAARLMALHRRYPNMLLHGSAMTKPEMVETLPFTSVASSSWLSPTRFGDTIVWDHGRLNRYPVRYRTECRVRHARDFEAAGFDPAAIQRAGTKQGQPGDNMVLTKYTLYAWKMWRDSVNARQPSSNSVTVTETPDNVTPLREAVAGPEPAVAGTVLAPPKDREVVMLPVLGIINREDAEVDGDGKSDQMQVNSRSVRQCNTCVIGSDCPGFNPGYKCAYNMPVRVETKTQRKAVLDGLHEMQLQRIGFLRLREEALGGYPDPNLSREMKLLSDMMATQAEIEDDSDFFEMTLKGRRGGAQGALSRIFGGDVGNAQQQLEGGGYSASETDQVLKAGLTR